MTAVRTFLAEARRPTNLDLIVPMALGVVCGVLGLVGAIGPERIGAAVLLVLSTYSASHVVQRAHDRRTEQAAQRLDDRVRELLSSEGPAVALRSEYPDDMKRLFANATRISLMGITVASLDRHRALIESALDRDVRIDLLACSVADPVVAWARFRSYINPEEPLPEVAAALRRRLRGFELLAAQRTTFTTKTVDHPPPYGLIIASRDREVLAVYVKLLEFRTAGGDFPVIRVDPVRDDEGWSEHFCAQFNRLWAVADDVAMSPS